VYTFKGIIIPGLILGSEPMADYDMVALTPDVKDELTDFLEESECETYYEAVGELLATSHATEGSA
jgi:hypothetical protein